MFGLSPTNPSPWPKHAVGECAPTRAPKGRRLLVPDRILRPREMATDYADDDDDDDVDDDDDDDDDDYDDADDHDDEDDDFVFVLPLC